jgi:hypothetical protein
MSLVATIVDPRTEPVPAAWDAFVAAERLLPLWSSDILRAADWCAPAASSFVLVEESVSGAPVALFHARHHGATRPSRYARPGRLPAVTLTECRIAPGLMDAGMAFAAGTAARDRTEAVRAFESAVRRRTGPGGLAIGYRELTDAHLAAVPAARRIRLRLSPTMVLHNEWSDLDGYLAARPRKFRAQLRKVRDGVRVAPELVESVDPGPACWLAEQVRRRHFPRAVPRPPLPELYFRHLAALPGSRFLTYRDEGGRLLAFTAVLDTGEDLLLVNWGSAAADGNLYFDQYRRLVELMISTGRRRMVMGKGMRDLKARYGARPEPLWGVVGLR